MVYRDETGYADDPEMGSGDASQLPSVDSIRASHNYKPQRKGWCSRGKVLCFIFLVAIVAIVASVGGGKGDDGSTEKSNQSKSIDGNDERDPDFYATTAFDTDATTADYYDATTADDGGTTAEDDPATTADDEGTSSYAEDDRSLI